jgi:prepilin-type N-terminal cleavage/methylation domain-containing protein
VLAAFMPLAVSASHKVQVLSGCRTGGIKAAFYGIMRRKISVSANAGFTLVEIMIVVAIIALLAAISVPGFRRARKRAQATRVLNDLRLIDGAIDQYAIERSKATGATVAVPDWTAYMKKGAALYATGKDLLGNDYGPQTVDSAPSVPLATYNSLSDVADTAFFWPFKPAAAAPCNGQCGSGG